jgi:hypothetical protein
LYCSSNRTQNDAVGMGQCEDNKNRMLRKIEIDRERVNDLRLSDAFIVTKYGSKFHIDVKEISR